MIYWFLSVKETEAIKLKLHLKLSYLYNFWRDVLLFSCTYSSLREDQTCPSLESGLIIPPLVKVTPTYLTNWGRKNGRVMVLSVIMLDGLSKLQVMTAPIKAAKTNPHWVHFWLKLFLDLIFRLKHLFACASYSFDFFMPFDVLLKPENGCQSISGHWPSLAPSSRIT